MVPSSGKSGGLRTGTVGSSNPPNVAVSLPTCEKDVTQGIRSSGLPDGIIPAGSKWVLFPPHVPTINLADGGNPPDANLPETSTPIKATPESGKRHSKKRLNLSKIEATHLIFDMRDRQEKAWKSNESEYQAAVPDWTSGKERGSGGELPHRLPATLPNRPGEDEVPPIPTDPTPEAPKWDNKRPHDDDKITEVPNEDQPAEPSKKKKKKKKKKDSKEAVPTRKDEDEGIWPSTSAVEPKDAANEATPARRPPKFWRRRPQPRKRRRNRKRMPNLRSFG